jgi:hypothetical protein
MRIEEKNTKHKKKCEGEQKRKDSLEVTDITCDKTKRLLLCRNAVVKSLFSQRLIPQQKNVTSTESAHTHAILHSDLEQREK